MHFRFLSSLFFCALLASGLLRAQTPEVKGGAELILVAKVMGTVTMTVDGNTSAVALNQAVPKKAKINTGANSNVILLFSNGATTRLESNTELVIEEYLQDPFASEVVPKALQAEPTASKTELALNYGELVGDVKPLHYDKGSSFKVRTPVGAAGIRGTTFRIVFRPSGTGQAFFTLSTAVGNVAFDTGTGGNNAGGATPGPIVSGSGTVSGLSVPQGEEYSITVNVTTNAQGQMVVTTSAPTGSSGSISSAALQAVTTAASDIAVAVQTAVFTPAPPAPPGGGGGGGGTTGSVGQGQGVTTTSTIQTPTINAEIKTTLPPPATQDRIVPTSPNN
jgi:hypothetical protein